MKTLEESRKAIDKIDEELIKLFEQRMEVVVDVAKYKKENNLPILHPDREKEVIQKNVDRLKDEQLKKYGERLITKLMEVSREYQKEKIGGWLWKSTDY